MEIHNIRLGLATNSSSSHSIVFLRKPPRDRGVSTAEFGWDTFTAASSTAKSDYLAATLRANLGKCGFDADTTDAVVRDWATLTHDRSEEGYVDHQSVMTLPRAWSGHGLDRNFFNALSAYLLREGVVILGGNDNSDSGIHPLASKAEDASVPLGRDDCEYTVARYDATGRYWTIFNRDSGCKVRFSFDDRNATPRKAEVPELVDLKITDFCPYDCAMCYQGSTREGQHASQIGNIAYALGQMRVFEVAIGGGEPTLHPEFSDILAHLKYYGVVPNFTTKSLAWLRDAKQRAAITRSAGAFAYSVESAADVNALVSAIGDAPVPQASVQVVMGTVSMAELGAILDAAAEARIRVTLLGFKTTGRGANYTPLPYRDEWRDVVAARKWRVNVGIDTALALESAPDLVKAGVDRRLFHVKEGAFSMYIDAVAGRVGPSSYCSPLAMRPCDMSEAALRTAFASFPGE